jgi:hypothetical protein
MMMVVVNFRHNVQELLMHNFVELVFGFKPSNYEVDESDVSIVVEIFFIQGIPGDYQSVVLISTHNGTATGQQILHKNLLLVMNLMIYL